jgi:hypothetical protein
MNNILFQNMIEISDLIQNEKNILVAMGLLLDGSYRENIQPAGVYNYI